MFRKKQLMGKFQPNVNARRPAARESTSSEEKTKLTQAQSEQSDEVPQMSSTIFQSHVEENNHDEEKNEVVEAQSEHQTDEVPQMSSTVFQSLAEEEYQHHEEKTGVMEVQISEPSTNFQSHYAEEEEYEEPQMVMELVQPNEYESGRSFKSEQRIKLTTARRALLPRIHEMAKKFGIEDKYYIDKMESIFAKIKNRSLQESAMAAFYVVACLSTKQTGNQAVTINQVKANAQLDIRKFGSALEEILDPRNGLISVEDVQTYYDDDGFSGFPLPSLDDSICGDHKREIRKLAEKIVQKVYFLSDKNLDKNSTKIAAAFLGFKSLCYKPKVKENDEIMNFCKQFNLEKLGTSVGSVSKMVGRIRKDLLQLAKERDPSSAKKNAKYLRQNLSNILECKISDDDGDDVLPTPQGPPIVQMTGSSQEEIGVMMEQKSPLDLSEADLQKLFFEDQPLFEFREKQFDQNEGKKDAEQRGKRKKAPPKRAAVRVKKAENDATYSDEECTADQYEEEEFSE